MPAQLSAVGRLIADPETKFFDSGRSKTTLRVAVNHQGKKPEGQQYPDSDIYYAEVWGPRGETAANKLTKGESVWITGRLETSKGKDDRFLNVKNAEWDFVGGKRESKSQEQGGGYDAEELPF